MKVIRYFQSERQAYWLEQIGKSDWNAARFLCKLVREGNFFETLGEHSDILLLTQEDTLLSFCTFAEKDDIQPTALTPWVGFVFTFPEYRGQRLAGKLLEEAARLAARDHLPALFLSTNHTGLYEKYGFRFFATMTDVEGEPSRVYIRPLGRTLVSERLVLRRWEESDAAELFRYAQNPAVGPKAGWSPHKSVEESREIIRTLLSGEEAYAVCLKENNQPVGAIELMLHGKQKLAVKEDECELGFWLGEPFWGQGLITEAAKELLRHAFYECGMQRVWCMHYEGNLPSARVQQKLGFHYHHTQEAEVPYAGEIRTSIVNCLEKEDFHI